MKGYLRTAMFVLLVIVVGRFFADAQKDPVWEIATAEGNIAS